MDITPLTPKDRLIINRYGDDGFVVSEKTYKGNIIITHDRVMPWPVADIAAIAPDAFAVFLQGETLPEILLIGLGKKFTPLTPALRDAFRRKHIAVDPMDTGAACRTYNVLLSEGRSVAAALIAV